MPTRVTSLKFRSDVWPLFKRDIQKWRTCGFKMRRQQLRTTTSTRSTTNKACLLAAASTRPLGLAGHLGQILHGDNKGIAAWWKDRRPRWDYNLGAVMYLDLVKATASRSVVWILLVKCTRPFQSYSPHNCSNE
jgi:hypothetical protein